MWIIFAVGSAFFAGITAILAKCGIRQTDSHVATAIRTIIVLVFAWMMVWVTGSPVDLRDISGRTLLYLTLSGLATGASWLCYFRALSIGNVNKVVAVDKSSIILTLMLAFLFLHEDITWLKGAATVLIGVGTFWMIEKKKSDKKEKEPGRGWFLYASLSAFFASLTSILGKIGITDIESNLGTALRTGVVLVMAWLVVLVTGKIKKVKETPRRELIFILLSGVATGASWLCYYRALQTGPASGVVPIDKLSIVVTIVFSYFVFHERLSKRGLAGLMLIVVGTLVMVIG